MYTRFRLKENRDGESLGTEMIEQLLCEWRRRLSVVQSDVRTVEPLLRLRRILLRQTQVLSGVEMEFSSARSVSGMFN